MDSCETREHCEFLDRVDLTTKLGTKEVDYGTRHGIHALLSVSTSLLGTGFPHKMPDRFSAVFSSLIIANAQYQEKDGYSLEIILLFLLFINRSTIEIIEIELKVVPIVE